MAHLPPTLSVFDPHAMSSPAHSLKEIRYRGEIPHQHDRIAILVSKWHPEITEAMYESARQTLAESGVERIVKFNVPGSYELPLAAKQLAASQHFDAILCIGVVIKGETRHNEYISQAVANGVMQVSLDYNLPVVFGVLTTEDLQQALDRAGGKYGNKGQEAAVAALEMIEMIRHVRLG